MEHLPPVGVIHQSLFPYETADKLLRFPLAAGSFTNIQVQTNSGLDLWEPWSDQSPHVPLIEIFINM